MTFGRSTAAFILLSLGAIGARAEEVRPAPAELAAKIAADMGCPAGKVRVELRGSVAISRGCRGDEHWSYDVGEPLRRKAVQTTRPGIPALQKRAGRELGCKRLDFGVHYGAEGPVYATASCRDRLRCFAAAGDSWAPTDCLVNAPVDGGTP